MVYSVVYSAVMYRSLRFSQGEWIALICLCTRSIIASANYRLREIILITRYVIIV